jgi:hypothetical protein
MESPRPKVIRSALGIHDAGDPMTAPYLIAGLVAAALANTWEWNGLRLGMDADAAWRALAAICKVKVVENPETGRYATTSLVCMDSSAVVAERAAGKVTVAIYDGKAIEIAFVAPARDPSPGEYRRRVQGALEYKYGEGKRVRRGTRWEPDATLAVTLTVLDEDSSFSVAYADRKAQLRRLRAEMRIRRLKIKEAARGI